MTTAVAARVSWAAMVPAAAEEPPPVAVTSPAERAECGRAVRGRVPRASHGEWQPVADRPDPVAILARQAETRVPDLVPLRHRRMLASAFTFYRGGAAIMASDLAPAPNSGLRTQLCGDAHLSNFGGFAAPDRRMVFDCNDFDETLPGPFEWDLKRLAASFEIGARERGFAGKERRAIVRAAAGQYRRTMAELGALGEIELRYLRFDAATLISEYGDTVGRQGRKMVDRSLAKATAKTRMRALAKLTERVDGKLRIVSQPPVIVPIEELAGPEEAVALVRAVLDGYAATLSEENRYLFERYRYVHGARKVVGVGSVGTRAWLTLLVGRDEGDPLFLQIKEAEASVLEPFAGASGFTHHGRRVVEGQRLMQAAGDFLLGWTSVTIPGAGDRHFYVRQFWDQKASAQVELMAPPHMEAFARLCGATLARGHARSGDRIAISSYLGSGSKFDRAMSRFADAYADQNELDFAAFEQAVEEGRLEASVEG